jgi:hypothetical protein
VGISTPFLHPSGFCPVQQVLIMFAARQDSPLTWTAEQPVSCSTPIPILSPSSTGLAGSAPLGWLGQLAWPCPCPTACSRTVSSYPCAILRVANFPREGFPSKPAQGAELLRIVGTVTMIDRKRLVQPGSWVLPHPALSSFRMLHWIHQRRVGALLWLPLFPCRILYILSFK